MRPQEPIRQVHGPLFSERCEARSLPRVRGVAQRAGISYQRRVTKALSLTASRVGGQVEAEPWFRFEDARGQGQAVPDVLFHLGDITLVIEVKYTFTEDAIVKLRGLYVPVVEGVLKTRVRPLVICKNLIPQALNTVLDIRGALCLSPAHIPTLQWLGHGRIEF